MRTSFKTILFCAFALTFTSCSITEEIWVNADGSGRLAFTSDVGGFFPIINMALQNKAPSEIEEDDYFGDDVVIEDIVIEDAPSEDTPEEMYPEITLDDVTIEWDTTQVDVEQVVIEDVYADTPVEDEYIDESDSYWNEPPVRNPGKEQAMAFLENIFAREQMDTTIYLRAIAQDLLEQQGLSMNDFMGLLKNGGLSEEGIDAEDSKAIAKMLNGLLDMDIRLQMNKPKSQLLFTMGFPFKQPSEALSFFDGLEPLMQKFAAQDGNAAELDVFEQSLNSITHYDLQGRTFHATRLPYVLPEGVAGDDADMMKGMQMFMGASKYRFIIHLPGKIKSCNLPDAEIDGNTLSWEMPLLKIYDPQGGFDIQVDFKPKRNFTWDLSPAALQQQ